MDKSKYAASLIFLDEEGQFADTISRLVSSEDYQWIDRKDFSGWQITIGSLTLPDLERQIAVIFNEINSYITKANE